MVNRSHMAAMAASALFCLTTSAPAQFLGTADTFAVLAGSAITNTGPTQLWGDMGVWPGTAISGFPPGIVTNGVVHNSDGVAMQAQADVTTAYNALAGEFVTRDLTGQDLGGLTLQAGVYNFSSSAFLTGTLTLDAQGDPNARFDFLMGSTLITASDSHVRIINGGDDCNVYWKVGSSATLGTNSDFAGHILALTDITLTTGATILDGSALARNGEVTMDSNMVSTCNGRVLTPEPITMSLGVAGVALFLRRRKAH